MSILTPTAASALMYPINMSLKYPMAKNGAVNSPPIRMKTAYISTTSTVEAIMKKRQFMRKITKVMQMIL
jgi:hypothetical protein